MLADVVAELEKKGSRGGKVSPRSSAASALNKRNHMRIGVISDTHGYLDPRATVALRGVARILHAGDIGSPAIVDALTPK